MASLKELDLSPFVNKAVADVFSTMLSMKVKPLDPANAGQVDLNASSSDGTSPETEEEKYMGLVGLAGKISGAVCLTFSAKCASFLAAAMLGLGEEELGTAEVKDVIGELCNMVGGNIKSRLCDMGMDCVLTIPSITVGKNFKFQPLKDPIIWEYGYLTEGFPWLLKLYLKETQ